MIKKLKFEELSLSKETLKAIADLGFEEASPIQAEAIPLVLEGCDIVGQAMTGTGKTAAFGIPLVEKVDPKIHAIQALVLCPTRELAIQVSVELGKLLKYKRNVFVLPIYGGQPIERQIHALSRGVHIVIGTPGRLIDHINRGTLNLASVKFVVLDEADQMLDMGFRDDMETILQQTQKGHQTVLFSATMSREILILAKRYQNNPKTIKIAHEVVTVPAVEQICFDVDSRMKLELLSRLIDLNNPKSSIVFCNTKRKVDDVVSGLVSRGYAADGIHGDISQPKRDRVMEKFRKGIIEVLVATDVAARGIDVPHVEAVFNFEIPQDEESYVHRIGRTGRAGRAGKAFSFISMHEQYEFRSILRYTNAPITKQPLPSLDYLEEFKNNKLFVEIKESIQEGGLEKYIKRIEILVAQGLSAVEIAAAFLKIVSHKKNQPKEDLLTQSMSQAGPRDDRSGHYRRFGGDRRAPRRNSSRSNRNW
jgi:ATP-dependent RNA helicase DeaD